MRQAQLTYDGTTYLLDEAAVTELVGRGAIVADPMIPDEFELAPSHLIQEVESIAKFAGFRSGQAARHETQLTGKSDLLATSFQYHRDGQGGA